MEDLKNPDAIPEPQFEVSEPEPGVTLYLFDRVGVVFDASNENQDQYVELKFGTYDKNVSIEDQKGEVFLQRKDLGVHLPEVIDDIRAAAAHYGEDTFWIFPSKDDNRGEARLRLFQRYANLEPDGNDFGYILKL